MFKVTFPRTTWWLQFLRGWCGKLKSYPCSFVPFCIALLSCGSQIIHHVLSKHIIIRTRNALLSMSFLHTRVFFASDQLSGVFFLVSIVSLLSFFQFNCIWIQVKIIMLLNKVKLLDITKNILSPNQRVVETITTMIIRIRIKVVYTVVYTYSLIPYHLLHFISSNFKK